MTAYRPYFAYGSNLNERDWKSRTSPNSGLVPLELACLPDHRLAFNIHSHGRDGGVLNVVQSKGHVVEGYLFDLAEDAAVALHSKEGPRYVKRHVIVIGEDGREIEAFTYVGRPGVAVGYVPPHEDYLRVCRKGREILGCCTEMLDAAAKNEEPAVLDAIFAYGTLMRHEERFGCLQPFQPNCIILAEVFGSLASHGSYPGMRLGGDRQVAGEFMRLEAVGQALGVLDAVEGFGGFDAPGGLFRRTLVDVHVGDGRVRRAWTYVTTRAGEPIASGCWRSHRGSMTAFRAALVAAHAEGYPDFAEAIWSWTRRFATDARRPASYDIGTIEEELATGRVSERRLAMISGRGALVPVIPASQRH